MYHTQDVYAALFSLNLPESEVPKHIHGCFERYIHNRIPPGSFVEALLCNDLRSVLTRADNINILKLQDIVAWMMFNLPHNSWGSKELYQNWLAGKN